MKILMLTAKCGMGHYKCASAIEEKIKSTYPKAEISVIDIYEEQFSWAVTYFYKFYKFIVNHGNFLYNLAYKKVLRSAEKTGPLKFLAQILLRDFPDLIERQTPDLVISTYSFTSELMSYYKEKTGSTIPLVTWITDLRPHNGWVNARTDYYVVADSSTKRDLRLMGVREDQIKIGGIPVQDKFSSAQGKDLGQKKKVLLMGGGLGMLPRDLDFYQGLVALDQVDLTVVTGENKSLYKKLKSSFPTIKVLGFVDNVDQLMEEADLLITKAGGITTFEAIETQTPMLVFKPFLDQEVSNANFISNKEIGLVLPSKMSKSKKDLDIILGVLKNDDLIRDMKTNMEKIKTSIDPFVINKVLLGASGLCL
ncbi:MAG: glycosyltransferase [Bacillota bacterium]|nr:glycosyltransferase [Bacillota bacterium]